ncbi:rRNA adenine methyltransferase [Chitinophaga niabensis]|uniref:TPR repeat-containing protein n=1 Tax=Chitinophaga niabensis TaxID=536979 RepID=A0A1N6EC94_9BACT|nr:rRNA adenine methyltransferase [Chitinophaga niabensis]SIN80640.1 TPR repeat-containing protein [Chitinophaga niabensis]
MEFNQDSKTIQLCIQGMELEGQGQPSAALLLFQQALDVANNNTDKFTAAHYIARHQNSVADKLKWDEIALQLALNIDDDTVKSTYPSLYLNVAKCYEDLGNHANALKHYELANSFTHFLPDDGYGNMIRAGIWQGMKRIS